VAEILNINLQERAFKKSKNWIHEIESTSQLDQTNFSRFGQAVRLFRKLQNITIFEGIQDDITDPLSLKHFEQDLRFLRSKFIRDIKVNILICIAFVLNPYSGVQILINLCKLDLSKFDNLSSYNK